MLIAHLHAPPQFVIPASSSDEMKKTPACAALTCAQRLPAMLRTLHILLSHSLTHPVCRNARHARPALSPYLDGLAILEGPVVS